MSKRTPSLCRHKATGQAVVRIDGRDFYCGAYGTPEAQAEYDRLIAEWLSSGRCLPEAADTLTVNKLILAHWRWAEAYYRWGKRGGQCLRYALAVLRDLYGHTPAKEFGPRALKACRQRMIEKRWSRTYTNTQTNRIRGCFKWAAEEELLPGSIHQNLNAVAGLQAGHTEARETERVKPVPQETVDATLPHLPKPVQAMVRLQLLTGCRPGEVCAIRPVDLDMKNPACWVYRPGSDQGPHGQHKTAHHGHDRLILIGPKAQEVLLPYLGTKLDAYCFSPAESEAQRNAARKERRQTPMTPSDTSKIIGFLLFVLGNTLCRQNLRKATNRDGSGGDGGSPRHRRVGRPRVVIEHVDPALEVAPAGRSGGRYCAATSGPCADSQENPRAHPGAPREWYQRPLAFQKGRGQPRPGIAADPTAVWSVMAPNVGAGHPAPELAPPHALTVTTAVTHTTRAARGGRSGLRLPVLG